MPRFVLFIDDGDVMNDNARRGPQWQRLLGEFFPPLLGGAPEAWAEANRIAAPRLWTNDYFRATWRRANADYAAFYRAYLLDWLRGMCELVGVTMPPEKESVDLARRATNYVTRRVRSAFPGVVEAIRTLHARGYQLHTASGESSTELDGYLEGMGVRGCFGRLYGPDLVNTLKEGLEYYRRIFADVGVAPSDALVVDNSPTALRWAAQVGARTALVGCADGKECQPDLVIASLSALPRAAEALEVG